MADPPWPYASPRALVGNGGRGTEMSNGRHISTSVQVDIAQHYPSMSLDDIKALAVSPLANDDGCHLYLWTTNSFIVQAHEVAASWGFTPKTIITWGKIRKQDRSSFEPSRKTGYWFRSATEHCLFAIRGKLCLETADAMPTLFLEERFPHSVKPDSFRAMVERCSPEPRLEMFARKTSPGWDVWGNEVQSDVIL